MKNKLEQLREAIGGFEKSNWVEETILFMTNKEIKAQCESLYAVIKTAQEDLAEIRKACPHTETFMGDYEWAPGHGAESEICSSCGEVVDFGGLKKILNNKP